MFAVTLYDAVYMYFNLANDVIKRGGNKDDITNGRLMYREAKNANLKGTCMLCYHC